MIFCRPFNYPVVVPTYTGLTEAKVLVPGIHVSAAKKKNAVFVFARNPKNDNLEVYKYIENLTFEQEDAAESTKVKTS